MSSEFIGQRFCQECSNMLYPDAMHDRDLDDGWGLVFKCRVCDYSELAKPGDENENCVYRTDLEAKLKDLIINPDIVDDPSLQEREIAKCRNDKKACNGTRVVSFFHITKEEFSLVYVCKKCKHWLRMQEKDPKDIPMISDLSDSENKKFKEAYEKFAVEKQLKHETLP